MVRQGDVLDELAALPDESVHCVVTSPPYWGLRDYGVAGQIGLEPTPEEYVAKMVEVFREVRRVLRKDGTLWLNLGDSYAANRSYQVTDNKHVDVGNNGAMTVPPGLKPKDLVGIPWRLAFALQADGWWLRSDIIWAKPNPMPESVTDRPTKADEYLFLLTKSARYFYDADAIREPARGGPPFSTDRRPLESAGPGQPPQRAAQRYAVRPGIDTKGGGQGSGVIEWNPNSRNLRDVWTIATQAYPEAHFATYPEDLVIPCIKAGTSERGVCPECGAPWKRVVERTSMVVRPSANRHAALDAGSGGGRTDTRGTMLEAPTAVTTGWEPSCDHALEPIPATVLDPFAGSGTTLAVARRLGRRSVDIELNPEYVELIRARIAEAALPLLEAI